MTYRNCKIWQNDLGKYEWQHPTRVDYDHEIGSIWSGWGHSVEECIEQIDEWYEKTQG